MTTGNVTSAVDLASVMASIKVSGTDDISQTSKGANDFGSLISGTKATSQIPDFGKSMSQTSSNTLSASDRVKTSSKSDADKSDIKDIYDDIKDTVKDTLGIDDEKLEEKMSELGITVADLLEPQNLANLVASVNDTDVAAVITDSDLSEQLTELTNAISDIVDEALSTFDMSEDGLKDALEGFENLLADSAMTEAEPEIEIQTVKDANGNEIKVTLEDNTVAETVTTQKASETEKEDFGDGKQDSKDNLENKNFAEQVVSDLNNAISEATNATESFGDVYSVNQADLIDQVLDAIKVNVSADTTSMEIQLTPENLGKLNLNVATKDGAVTATITTQNEAVKAIVETQLIQLKETLNAQGLKVTDVEVTVAAHGFDMNGEHNTEDGNQNSSSRNQRRFRTDDELPGMEEIMADATEQQIMEVKGNSVSYKA